MACGSNVSHHKLRSSYLRPTNSTGVQSIHGNLPSTIQVDVSRDLESLRREERALTAEILNLLGIRPSTSVEGGSFRSGSPAPCQAWGQSYCQASGQEDARRGRSRTFVPCALAGVSQRRPTDHSDAESAPRRSHSNDRDGGKGPIAHEPGDVSGADDRRGASPPQRNISEPPSAFPPFRPRPVGPSPSEVRRSNNDVPDAGSRRKSTFDSPARERIVNHQAHTLFRPSSRGDNSRWWRSGETPSLPRPQSLPWLRREPENPHREMVERKLIDQGEHKATAARALWFERRRTNARHQPEEHNNDVLDQGATSDGVRSTSHRASFRNPSTEHWLARFQGSMESERGGSRLLREGVDREGKETDLRLPARDDHSSWPPPPTAHDRNHFPRSRSASPRRRTPPLPTLAATMHEHRRNRHYGGASVIRGLSTPITSPGWPGSAGDAHIRGGVALRVREPDHRAFESRMWRTTRSDDSHQLVLSATPSRMRNVSSPGNDPSALSPLLTRHGSSENRSPSPESTGYRTGDSVGHPNRRSIGAETCGEGIASDSQKMEGTGRDRTLSDGAETKRRQDRVVRRSGTSGGRGCQEDGCDRRPIYSFKDSKKAAYCARHRLPGMVDTRHPLCKNEKCIRQPSFGMEVTIQRYC